MTEWWGSVYGGGCGGGGVAAVVEGMGVNTRGGVEVHLEGT